MPGESADFAFTTLPGMGLLEGGWTGLTGVEATGPAAVPGRPVKITVDGLADAAKKTAPGKKIHINDNIDENQIQAGVGPPVVQSPPTPLWISPDYAANPVTGQDQIKIGDPDLVGATLDIGPPGTVGSLTWDTAGGVFGPPANPALKVYWNDGNGNWVRVTDQNNFTAPAMPIDLMLEGASIFSGRYQVTFRPKNVLWGDSDQFNYTVYTGLKVTGTYRSDFASQVGDAAAWTTGIDDNGNVWRTGWMATTDPQSRPWQALAEAWQLRARGKLDPIFGNATQMSVQAVWASAVTVDLFALNQVDPKDIAVCVAFERSFGSAIVTHVLVEQYEKQINGVNDFTTAHATASAAEGYVYVGGGTRTIIEQPAMGATSGTFRYRYAFGGVSTDVVYDWDGQQATNISNIHHP